MPRDRDDVYSGSCHALNTTSSTTKTPSLSRHEGSQRKYSIAYKSKRLISHAPWTFTIQHGGTICVRCEACIFPTHVRRSATGHTYFSSFFFTGPVLAPVSSVRRMRVRSLLFTFNVLVSPCSATDLLCASRAARLHNHCESKDGSQDELNDRRQHAKVAQLTRASARQGPGLGSTTLGLALGYIAKQQAVRLQPTRVNCMAGLANAVRYHHGGHNDKGAASAPPSQ